MSWNYNLAKQQEKDKDQLRVPCLSLAIKKQQSSASFLSKSLSLFAFPLQTKPNLSFSLISRSACSIIFMSIKGYETPNAIAEESMGETKGLEMKGVG